uniref:EGF-like domain-containing protein n=1 Tax=Ditylenchus dipsaci TaxID=166011 RepID=A0A915EMZ5_9BILA
MRNSVYFWRLAELRLLDLSNNQLRCVTKSTLGRLNKLHTLFISENQFACNCHLQDFIYSLKTASSVKVLDTVTCFEPAHLQNRSLVSLDDKELVCNDDRENVCAENGNYCPSGCVCAKTVVRCTNRQLSQFPLGIPLDTTELYLDNNMLTSLPVDQLHNLTNLIKLDLSQNQIAVIQNGTFLNNLKLTTLILSYNNLKCLEESAFWGLTNLRILSLHGNELSRLPESAFTDLINITHVALGSNSLYCDCSMAWFSKWIKARFVEPGIAKCESPSRLKNQLLLTATNQQFRCDEPVPKEVLANAMLVRILLVEQVCPVGYYGSNCKSQIDACYGDPCLNNATCSVIQAGRFKCQCQEGFTGERCETNVDDCVGNKCENGAACVDEINAYHCDCPLNFIGKYCEQKLTYCSKLLNPCQNGAQCIARADGNAYSCICQAGFSGRNCSQNIDDCHKHKCENSGVCVDGINSYTCRCPIAFWGDRCEKVAPASSLDSPINRLHRNTDEGRCSAANCEHGFCKPQH